MAGSEPGRRVPAGRGLALGLGIGLGIGLLWGSLPAAAQPGAMPALPETLAAIRIELPPGSAGSVTIELELDRLLVDLVLVGRHLRGCSG